VKEGYALGENFLIRVWKDSLEYSTIGCYVPEDTYAQNEPSATGSFVPFGLSYLNCLKTAATPGSNLGCDAPIPIACGETKIGNNADGVFQAVAYSCFDNLVDGPEVVYIFTNPVQQNVLITLSGLQSDLELLLLQACDHNTCIEVSDRTGPSPEAITAENLPAGTYYIVVEGYLGASSNYQLAVACGSTIPTNGTLDCGAPTALTCGQTISDNTNTGSDLILQYNCSNGYESGREKIYAFSTPDTNRFVVISLEGLSADLDLFALSECNVDACFAASDNEGLTPEQLTFIVAPGRIYYVVVDGYFDQQSPFTLTAECYEYDPNYMPCDTCPVPDYQVDCSQAQPLTCGVPTTGNTQDGQWNAYYYSCHGQADGKELVYTFDNPITQDVTFILSGLSENLNLFVLNDCNIFNCIGVGNKTGTSDEGIVKQALLPGRYYVVVEGFDALTESGFTLLVNCTNSSLICQDIPLVPGTNFISSNILPIDPSIEQIFPPSAQSLIISIENQNNQVYSPSAQTNPDDFDDWDFRKAYRVKALAADTLHICGNAKADANTPIPYATNTAQGLPLNNWTAYLKDVPMPVAELFPSEPSDIFRVWNMPTGPTGNLTPQSFLVNLQSGTNFTMQAGRGYILNASADGIYTYGFHPNGQVEERSDNQPQSPLVVKNGCQHFTTSYQATLRSATVLVPHSVLETLLMPGDEIGLFTTDGLLCGSAHYVAGYALALLAVGDDPSTPNHREGFAEGEQLTLRLWRATDGQTYDLAATFTAGDRTFSNEAIFYVNSLEIRQISAATASTADVAWSIYPNPAYDAIRVDVLLPAASPVLLQLLMPDGQVAQEIFSGFTVDKYQNWRADVRGLPAGFYWLRLTTAQGVAVKKLILSK
jgi:hypothetical protein